jgi:hypothetical protein
MKLIQSMCKILYAYAIHFVFSHNSGSLVPTFVTLKYVNALNNTTALQLTYILGAFGK